MPWITKKWTLVLLFLSLMWVEYYVHFGEQTGKGSSPQWPAFVAYPMKNLHELPNWKHYIALGKTPPTSEFPKDESITVTNGEHVHRRSAPMKVLYSCYGKPPLKDGKNAIENSFTRSNALLYDFVILPVGCFGDYLSNCTSCTLSRVLVNATYCGRKKMGLFLGDNFYPYGITRRYSSRFQKDLYHKFFKFEELQMIFYATSGNHDTRPRYLYRNDLKYWHMPSPYYRSGIQESSGTTLEIFTFSTNPYDMRIYTHNFFKKQAAWLDAALANSTARWKIVMTHEPIFSFSGFLHHEKSLKVVHPILKRRRVQLLVSSHVHGIFLHRVEGGYYQLVSAGFASNLQTMTQPRRPLGYNHLGIGATALFVEHDVMTVVASDAKGQLIFHHKIPYEMDRSDVPRTAIALHSDFDVFKRHEPSEHFFPLSFSKSLP